MINAAALRERKKQLERQRTRETTILGRVIEDGAEAEATNALPYRSEPCEDGGDFEIEAALEGNEEPSELMLKARWMVNRGSGFECGTGRKVGVFVLAKEKHERHYDQLAFLLHTHFKVSQIDARDIQDGILTELDTIVFPGAYIGDQMSTLGWENYERVKEFVRGGGKYVGFCSGGFLAVQNGFVGCRPETALVPNVPTSWSQGVGQCECSATAQLTQLLGVENAPKTLYFANGPKFKASASIRPLLLYESILKQSEESFAVAAFEASVGRGRVVAFGPHPESSVGWKKPLLQLFQK